jgi:hypothetical protein
VEVAGTEVPGPVQLVAMVETSYWNVDQKQHYVISVSKKTEGRKLVMDSTVGKYSH